MKTGYKHKQLKNIAIIERKLMFKKYVCMYEGGLVTYQL